MESNSQKTARNNVKHDPSEGRREAVSSGKRKMRAEGSAQSCRTLLHVLLLRADG